MVGVMRRLLGKGLIVCLIIIESRPGDVYVLEMLLVE